MAHTIKIDEIFKSRINILALLKEQGYNIENYENASINEVNSMYQAKQMDMLVENGEKKKAYIKYHLAKSLRASNLYDFIEDLMNIEEILKKTDDLIIIIKDEPNESFIKILKNMWEQDGIFITVFNIKRLQFNILEHELVPKHSILSSEEVDAFKQKYFINNNKQIPDISRFSPVAMAIGMRPGNICKIIRSSKTAINTDFYRICSP